MKRLHKILIVVMSTLLFVCTALFIAACDTESKGPFTVSISCDTTKGSITASAPENGAAYAKGESVTLTATPKEGYVVEFFAVSGHEDASLTNGTYTFEITADAIVMATFKADDAQQGTDPGAQSGVYTVTLSYDRTQGLVEVTRPKVGAKYAEGEEVTVTVQPHTGYEIGTFTVSGYEDAVLTDGAYTFAVQDNTKVTVTFEATTMPEELLSTLRGSVKLEGGYLYTETIDDWRVYFDVTALFDSTHGAVWLQESYGTTRTYNAVYVNVDGYLNLVLHDEEGKYAPAASTERFEDFGNPFEWLTGEEFLCVADGVWSLSTDATRADKAATAITGWKDPVVSFNLYEENGEIVLIEITTQAVIGAGTGADYTRTSEYLYVVSEAGTATIPDEWFADYEETAEHAALKSALENAAAAESYTVQYHSVEEGYEDVDYNIYVTEKAIYEDCVGWESGYVQRRDGVYPFYYYPETNAFDYGESLTGITLADISASFEIGVSLAMLESKGNGVFAARDVDLFVEDADSGLAAAFATAFADGLNKLILFSYAVDFEVTIENGLLSKVEFTYNYNGYITERVTLTYGAFNETELPITLEEVDYDDNGRTPIFDQTYAGIWTGERYGKTYRVEIEQDAIYVTMGGSRLRANVTKYDDTYGFSTDVYFTLGDSETEYELWAGGGLGFSDGTVYVSLAKWDGTETPEPDVPCEWEAFIGTFEGAKNGATYKIVITRTTVTVTVNGTAYDVEIKDFDDYEGFTLLIDGDEFYITNAEYNTRNVNKIAFMSEDLRTIQVVLDRV